MASDRMQKSILALCNARTDTERFAALLFITKIIDAGDCSFDERRQLFEAVGFEFVNRLLLSEDVPEGCSQHIFRSLALNLLATFCTVPELITSENMDDKVPHFLKVLTEYGFSKEERAMKNDALTCLLSLTSSRKSCNVIVDHGGMAQLCDIFAHDDARLNFKEQVFSVISSVVSQLGCECWCRKPESFHVLMNALSKRLIDEEKSQRKFVMCDVIRRVLFSLPPELKESSSSELWYHQFNEELLGILCFKLGDAQREPLLKLCSTLVEKLGVSWALGIGEKSMRLYFLLVQLCCIEVRMIIEGRTFEEVMQKSDLAAASFIVVECTIHFLIYDNGQTISETSQQQLYNGLTNAFTAILSFLKLVSEKFDCFYANSNELEQSFVLAAIRVTGAWLAEETAALREDVYRVLPFLVQYAAEQYKYETSFQCLRFLLPGLCHLSVEDPARAILLDQQIPQLLTNFMIELWQQFKLDTLTVDSVELDRADRNLDGGCENALVTICGVQMNIVVLEAGNIVNYPGFVELLQFVVVSLPEIDTKVRHLILRGNLSILGLLLFRRYADMTETGMYRCLSASIRFLWDAFNVEDSSDGSSLAVAFAYRFIWDQVKELWFLGMQALSSLLSLMPWTAQFVMDSGWAQQIIATLSKAKENGLEGSIRMAYEDFLCNLVKCCDSAVESLKEYGAMKMCSVHKMKELGRLLRTHLSS